MPLPRLKVKRKASLFPLEFQKALVVHEMDYTRLSRQMAGRGYRLSKQFIGAMAIGSRSVPPETLVKMAETMGLNQQERQRLHRAAAIDIGFDIGPIDA